MGRCKAVGRARTQMKAPIRAVKMGVVGAREREGREKGEGRLVEEGSEAKPGLG